MNADDYRKSAEEAEADRNRMEPMFEEIVKGCTNRYHYVMGCISQIGLYAPEVDIGPDEVVGQVLAHMTSGDADILLLMAMLREKLVERRNLMLLKHIRERLEKQGLDHKAVFEKQLSVAGPVDAENAKLTLRELIADFELGQPGKA